MGLGLAAPSFRPPPTLSYPVSVPSVGSAGVSNGLDAGPGSRRRRGLAESAIEPPRRRTAPRTSRLRIPPPTTPLGPGRRMQAASKRRIRTPRPCISRNSSLSRRSWGFKRVLSPSITRSRRFSFEPTVGGGQENKPAPAAAVEMPGKRTRKLQLAVDTAGPARPAR